MNYLLEKIHRLCKHKLEKPENTRLYKVVQVRSSIPNTNMFIVVATNNLKILGDKQ